MQHIPRIKICGITRKQDALAAAELGADALGFVFYENSPRYIAPPAAAAIIGALPPFVNAVGLFVNASQTAINETLAVCPLDILQLHGDESPEFCAAQARRVIKSVPVEKADDLSRASGFDCAILLDAKAPKGIYGGTGASFDWKLLEGFEHTHAVILAGGLDAENVAEALRVRQFYGVDVSSGVEASPGIKDAEKMRRFIASAHQLRA